MLELTNVVLSSEDTTSFDHTFATGEITVVLGANQSGKTDLCRLIAGLNTRAHGDVRLDGVDLSKFKPQARPVSLVYQAFVNYPNLTVAENIASPLRARRVTATELEKRVDELAAMLQISDLLKRMPHEISGGQQQRLAIARALAKDAQVLLLDEPLVNLDFKLREALEYELRGLLGTTNTVVIYTSTDPRDAFTLGDQVVLLAKGQKVQAGSPVDVYSDPSNLVAMELLAEPGVNRFTQSGKTCVLRPEHVALGKAKDQDTTLDFKMTVTAYETNGVESFIHGQVNNDEWVVRCHGMHAVHVGSALDLHAHNSDVVSF